MTSNLTEPSIAVVGAGYWGKNLVRNFCALNGLHTVCDTNEVTLQAIASQYPGVSVAESYSQVLENPAIKAVALATPAPTHGELVRQALLADKDVFVEKPLCLSEQEGLELAGLSRERSRILMVGHLLWYHPAVLRLKEMVDSGELGRLQYIYSNRLNLGKLRREENVLWSFAPHDISVILGLVGEMPESVHAEGGSFLHQKIADTTVTLLGFSSGIKAHIFVSWLHPFKEQKIVVVGDRAMAVLDDTASWPQKLQLYANTIEWSNNIPVTAEAKGCFVEVDEGEPLRAECAHFMECVETRRKPRTDGMEGVRVLKVLNLCQSALEKRTAVNPPPAITSTDYFVHETAVVDEKVDIGVGVKIWHFSHLLPGSRIGERCNIGQNVVIGPNVKIGNGCKIQNNVSIYEGVELEDDVFCGPSMVFTNIHNPRSSVPRKNQFRPTLVKKGATLGANCTIICGVAIGQYAFVGAGAVVTKDVPNYALVAGIPAKQIGWMSQHGERLDLPLQGKAEAQCPTSGKYYSLSGTTLQISDQP